MSAIQHAYATANKATGLAAAAFTWSTGTTTNRAYLNDGRMDKTFSVGSSSSGANVIIDLGSAMALTAVAVLNSNIASATAPTLKVEGADDVGMSTNLVVAKAATTLSTTAPRHKDHVLQFASVTKRYWRLTWTWTGSFTLTLGELYLAVPTALTRASIYGDQDREEFITTRFTSYSGWKKGLFLAGPIRGRRLVFDDLSDSERAEVHAIIRATYGGAMPLLWCEKYEASATAAAAAYQDCIFGRVEGAIASSTEFDFSRFSVDPLEIRSEGRGVGA